MSIDVVPALMVASQLMGQGVIITVHHHVPQHQQGIGLPLLRPGVFQVSGHDVVLNSHHQRVSSKGDLDPKVGNQWFVKFLASTSPQEQVNIPQELDYLKSQKDTA
ncbi:hypothetical protein [Aeromonas sp. sif2433]|uniref:hypothetical protein n=1 Tax=Aeromonas sp. sif2433 TaxID=2854794 RepID=UPI001C469DE8|nr:hypothetical protein [Aeromonas sp. sif2433]MBV7414421.1 hypothetical protein [Aeromonas sp. sif2433]